MKIIILFALCFSFITSAAKQPEQWLTPERRKELNRIIYRPIIIKQEATQDGQMVYTWTNGLHGCVTTQKLDKVLGKPSKDARREELDAIKADRDTAKAERDAIKAERDTIKAERDEAKAERDTLKTENATLKKQKGSTK